jgi:hypothetical protein
VEERDRGQNPQPLPPLPPRLVRYGELPPTIKPPLRDMPPPPDSGEVELWEAFASGPAPEQLAVTPELNGAAQATALAAEGVQSVLADKKYVPIGLSRLDVGKREASAQAGPRPRGGRRREAAWMFSFYNYTDNVAVEVLLDEGARQVLGVAESRYQPAPVQEELDRAVALARGDRRLAERLSDDLEGTAILVSPVDPDDPRAYRRLFDVRFGRPDERLPRYMALVDLGSETVLSAGPVDGGVAHREGGP